MTFLNDEDQNGGLVAQQTPQTEAPAPTWKELFNASAESSSIGSFAESTTLGWERSLPDTQRFADPNYDPFDDIAGYEPYADAFSSSQSRYETDLIKRSIDRRLQNQDTVQRGGLAGLATTLATEPLAFVPVGGAAALTERIANSLLRFGAAGMATGVAGSAIVEGALQATDPTRTAEQSAVNIALGAGLGTAIGTAAGGVATFLAGRTGKAGAAFNEFRDMAENALKGEQTSAPGASTTGAMATRNTTMADETIKAGLGANYLDRLNQSEVVVGNPLARTRASESLVVRQISGELSETPYITQGNTVGIASPQAVETVIKRWQAPLAEALQELDNQFALYRLGRQRKFGDIARVGALDTYTQATRRTPERMTYGQFKDAVAFAMRRGDVSENPQVAAAAQAMREKVFEPLKLRAIEAGLLPEDVSIDTAISYLTRVYDKTKIIKQRGEFENRITSWLQGIQEDVKRQIAAGQPISEQNSIIKGMAKDAAQQAQEQPLARVEGAAPKGANVLGPDVAITPTGRKVPVDYAVVDVKSLVTSNTDDLRPNPAYPQELQPRDRTRGTTELQIKSILNPDRFRPELLGKTNDATSGAPIVGPDMVVQSGNARSITLRRAYGENGPAAKAYRDYLAAQGFDLNGIENPVLVRINRSNMTPEQLQAFTREANTSTILSMSATEKAMADAKALPDDVLDLAVDGDLTSAGNREFVRRSIQSIATQNELGQMVGSDGMLTQEGLRRVQGAMLAKAYDSPAVVQNILESTDSNIKAIGNALLDAAPSWNRLRSSVRAGAVPAEFDITDYLKEAVAVIDRARTEGKPVADYVNQTDIFKGAGVSPEAETLLRLFLAGDNLKQRVGQDKIAQALNYYAQEANKVQSGPSLFGEAAQTKPAQIVEAARAKGQGTTQDAAAAGRADLFQTPMEKPAGAKPVSEGVGAATGSAGGAAPEQPAAAQTVNQKPTAQAVKPEYVDFSRLDQGDLQSIAQEITDKIIGGAPGRSNYEPIPLTRGPLRERTLSIPDAQIEDFLENDIERVARIYTRTMSTDVELATKFGRADMADQMVQISDNYAILRADAEKNLTGKKLEDRMAQLEKGRKRDMQDLAGMRDRIRGTYAIPDDPNSLIVRTGRVARSLNYVRLLGGMTLSAIPDLANPILRHGFNRTFGTMAALQNKQLFRLAADEVKAAGTALDMVLDSRAMQLADIWDDYGRNSSFERGLQAAQDRFGVVSLMAPWNAAMKQFSGVMSQTRLLQEARNWTKGTIGRVERERMAHLGIDANMAGRIAEQAEHWKEDSGIIWANTANWSDREAVDAFRNAIVKEVDATIVTPGQDRPLWMSSEMGKVVGQFRSFAFTALTKVSVSSLQRADKNVMQGLVTAVALGMLVHGLKQVQYGRPLPEKPQDWIVAGLDRSGVMGWLFDANNMVEKATAGTVGVNPLLGTSKTSNRFAARNVTGSIAGPTFGLVQDLIDVTGSAVSGNFDRTQLEKLRRMVPYQNVPYLAWMFDQMENATGDALGLPPNGN